ncbi:hypothetical protein [Paratractidigestivibacter sp.]|uniref:hypothetical protein n=1 Tax=Paratractidigestivibacter sp. TaxID=2847316 RepID=UPI002AC987C3|nr:hypothetical protein [Paratractidigestivibacter sp.]
MTDQKQNPNQNLDAEISDTDLNEVSGGGDRSLFLPIVASAPTSVANAADDSVLPEDLLSVTYNRKRSGGNR